VIARTAHTKILLHYSVIIQYYSAYLDMLPQYHSASCRLDDASTLLEVAPDSDLAIRSWDNVSAPKSCLMSEPDRLRTGGDIAEATVHYIHNTNWYKIRYNHTCNICPTLLASAVENNFWVFFLNIQLFYIVWASKFAFRVKVNIETEPTTADKMLPCSWS